MSTGSRGRRKGAGSSVACASCPRGAAATRPSAPPGRRWAAARELLRWRRAGGTGLRPQGDEPRGLHGVGRGRTSARGADRGDRSHHRAGPHEGTRAAYLRCPDGCTVELIQAPEPPSDGPASDRSGEPEVAMGDTPRRQEAPAVPGPAPTRQAGGDPLRDGTPPPTNFDTGIASEANARRSGP
jgi:hypothetical protein